MRRNEESRCIGPQHGTVRQVFPQQDMNAGVDGGHRRPKRLKGVLHTGPVRDDLGMRVRQDRPGIKARHFVSESSRNVWIVYRCSSLRALPFCRYMYYMNFEHSCHTTSYIRARLTCAGGARLRASGRCCAARSRAWRRGARRGRGSSEGVGERVSLWNRI